MKTLSKKELIISYVNEANFENIFANVRYTKEVDAIKNRALLEGVNQVNSSVNIDPNFADETLSGSANYGRSFAKYYKVNLRASLDWRKFNNIRVFPSSDANQRECV
jgi:hypothetical protein